MQDYEVFTMRYLIDESSNVTKLDGAGRMRKLFISQQPGVRAAHDEAVVRHLGELILDHVVTIPVAL